MGKRAFRDLLALQRKGWNNIPSVALFPTPKKCKWEKLEGEQVYAFVLPHNYQQHADGSS